MRLQLLLVVALVGGSALGDTVLKNAGSTIGPVLSLDCVMDGGLFCARATGSSIGRLTCASASATTPGCVSLGAQTFSGTKVIDGGLTVNGFLYVDGGSFFARDVRIDAGLSVGGRIVADGGVFGFATSGTGVNGVATSGTGVNGTATDGVDGVGVKGSATGTGKGVFGSVDGTGTAVLGISTEGAGVSGESTDFHGVMGQSLTNHGGYFAGDTTSPARSALRIVPQDAEPTGSNLVGDIYVSGVGVAWICIAAGSPGTWKAIGALTGQSVVGTATSGSAITGNATSGVGVAGIATTGAGVTADSTAYYAAILQSDTSTPDRAALRIVPQDTQPAGPNQVGDIYVTTAGLLKICTVAGTPGTWVSVGAQ